MTALLVCAVLLLQASASPPSRSLEKQALTAYQSRDWATATQLYEQFHASGGGSPFTYDNLGVALANLGRWREAEAALRKAIERNPQHRWAYNHLGFVYREQGRHEQAIAMFRRQIEISPQDPYAYRNLAGVLALAGRLDEAERAAQTHEKLTYERGAVYIDMACNLNSRRQPDQAKKYLDQARAAGVERSLLAQESAHYFLTVGDYRRAEEQYSKLMEYRPYDSLASLRLGALYWDTGNLEKAAAAFARVITVDDNDRVTIHTSANTWRAVELTELARSPQAGAAILGDVPLDLARAALLVRLDRRRALPEPFQQACRDLLAEKNSPAAEASLRDALGWSLFEQGSFASALDELQRAYTLSPARRITAYHLAAALEKSGDAEQALSYYVRSLAPLAETAIDCGCEQPDLALREQIARAFYAKLRGTDAGFDSFRDQTLAAR